MLMTYFKLCNKAVTVNPQVEDKSFIAKTEILLQY